MQPPPPEKLFAVNADGSNALTWGQMAVKRNRLAHSLAKRLPANIVSGAIYSKNSVEWLLCQQACNIMGLRFSPINWHLVADEIAYIVDDCDADVVFFGVEYAQTVAAIRSRTPKVQLWVCMDGETIGAESLESLVAAAPEQAPPPTHSRQGGMVGYTGGTTGKPKGAVRSNKPQKPEQQMKTLQQWGLLRMMPQPVQLVAAPLYHALPGAWLQIGTVLGTTFVVMAKFDGIKVMAAIEKFKVNGFYMPPILLKRLMQLPAKDVASYDRSSVKTIMSGGAKCPANVKQGICDMFGRVLHELYGASELGGVAIMDPEHILEKPQSCGRPAAGIDVIIVDENRKKITKPNVSGEIFAKGMNIDGYHKLPDKTEESMLDGYFSVGDVGYIDEDGYLYITDRKIDMIISGGANIYPAQVEEVLHQHPAVEDVAVFGLADEEYGERVHAALKLVAGQQVAAKELLEWCSGKIGKFQLPQEADISFFSEDFPRTEAGKLRKKVLKAQVEARKKLPASKL